MSFDIDFNYTTAIESINGRIASLQTIVDANNSKLVLLQSSVYAGIVTSEISALEFVNTTNTTAIANYQDISNEIARVQALSQEEKALLYYFYITLGISKTTYMIKLLFNTHIVNDSRVVAVYNDTTSPADVKLLVAQMLYDQFPINSKCLSAHITGFF